MTLLRQLVLIAVLAVTTQAPRAQTPQQWVEWGDRLHGGFGSLVALGIRVGRDAMERLGSERRQLSVHYVDGPQSPCACALDGIALAVSASPGQRTLVLDPERGATGLLARVTFRHRPSGRQLTYEVPQTVLPLMQMINQQATGVGRYEAVMGLDAAMLFRVVPQ